MEYGLIGEKLPHSFSKIIHEDLGKYPYHLVELTKDELHTFLMERKFKGINVTIPYKKDVIKYLDYIDTSVKEIGACNLIVNKDGKLHGYNTDYLGAKEMIEYFGISIKDKSVAILGSGATSNTMEYVIKDLGAKEVFKVSRHPNDNEISYADLYDEYGYIEVVVNTTPKEMYPNNYEEVADIDRFPNLEAVIDVVYNPLRTNLVLKAKERGIKYAFGLFMLVSQAIYGIELFKGMKLDTHVVSQYFNKLLKQKENIVLVGMPSSGKTTIGKEIAKKLNRPFYDVDEVFVNKHHMEIKEYFAKYGEQSFRVEETKIIKELGLLQSVVIATGGGSVLKNENVRALKGNGKLIFLDRSLDKLITTDNRPLSNNKEDLKRRYFERYEIYKSVCDVRVDDDKSLHEVVKEVMEVIK